MALVEMRGIVKLFPGVVANDGVDLDIHQGEVHALLGENGAGKTTLMRILAGLYRPDEGEIRLDGKPLGFRSPRQAIDAGIGMVHQHFRLVESLTVAENVLLGWHTPRFLLGKRAGERQVQELARRYRLPVHPRARIWQLSVGEQQRVEILKALYRRVRVLILDEPTAVLTPQEVEELFDTVRSMAQEGTAVVFITHKLEEVMAVADRITVLRRGRREGTVQPGATDARALARMMVGRDVVLETPPGGGSPGGVVLKLDSVSAQSDRALPSLRDVSLEVRAGQIFGIAGVAGNGQRELAEVITGLRRATSGRVVLGDRDLSGRSARAMIRSGVAHVPEDRLGTGLIASMTAVENSVLKAYRRPPVGQGPFVDWGEARRMTEDIMRTLDVRAASPETRVRLLSGGNLQRLLLAREMSERPRVMVAVHPTRGLDVGATDAVRQALRAQQEAGVAILLISEDLDELVALADPIGVLFEGALVGVLPRSRCTVEDLGLLMAGAKLQEDSV
ncbi:MAG TPA: ABC transporter ATP-binding protein [Actinomycetota bacterium]|nr:ABC transporter ATP-binding protein [Actinomycetota bacterium]